MNQAQSPFRDVLNDECFFLPQDAAQIDNYSKSVRSVVLVTMSECQLPFSVILKQLMSIHCN